MAIRSDKPTFTTHGRHHIHEWRAPKQKLAPNVLLGKHVLKQYRKTLIDRADDEDKAKIERLLAGETIEVQIHEDITYNEIYDEGDNLWNFMFSQGIFAK